MGDHGSSLRAAIQGSTTGAAELLRGQLMLPSDSRFAAARYVEVPPAVEIAAWCEKCERPCGLERMAADGRCEECGAPLHAVTADELRVLLNYLQDHYKALVGKADARRVKAERRFERLVSLCYCPVCQKERHVERPKRAGAADEPLCRECGTQLDRVDAESFRELCDAYQVVFDENRELIKRLGGSPAPNPLPGTAGGIYRPPQTSRASRPIKLPPSGTRSDDDR